MNNLVYGSEECTKALKNTYKIANDEILLLSDEYYQKFKMYDDILIFMKECELEKRKIEHSIMDNMKEHGVAYCRERKVMWKNVAKTTIDTKKLKEDHPEILKDYIKESNYRVFKIK